MSSKIIQDRFKQLVEALVVETGLGGPEICQKMKIWAQSNRSYGCNPTTKQKKKSLEENGLRCFFCEKKLTSVDKIEYHHIDRGRLNPHIPENMVPAHKTCHANGYKRGEKMLGRIESQEEDGSSLVLDAEIGFYPTLMIEYKDEEEVHCRFTEDKKPPFRLKHKVSINDIRYDILSDSSTMTIDLKNGCLRGPWNEDGDRGEWQVYPDDFKKFLRFLRR